MTIVKQHSNTFTFLMFHYFNHFSSKRKMTKTHLSLLTRGRGRQKIALEHTHIYIFQLQTQSTQCLSHLQPYSLPDPSKQPFALCTCFVRHGCVYVLRQETQTGVVTACCMLVAMVMVKEENDMDTEPSGAGRTLPFGVSPGECCTYWHLSNDLHVKLWPHWWTSGNASCLESNRLGLNPAFPMGLFPGWVIVGT